MRAPAPHAGGGGRAPVRDFVKLAGLAAAEQHNTDHTARLARALREEYRLVMLRLLVRLGPSL